MFSKTSAIPANSSLANNAASAPSLSYADRAKKGRKEKQPTLTISSISNPLQRPANPSTTGTTPSTTASGSNASKDGSNPASADVTPNSSVIMTRPESPLTNGILKDATSSISPTTTTTAVAPTPAASNKPAPVPNVWNIRKEQMALKAAGHPPSAQTAPSSALGPPPSSSLQKSPQNLVTSPTVSRNNAPPFVFRPPPSATPLQNANHRPPVLNGNPSPSNRLTTSTAESEDPFVVRVPPNTHLPPLSARSIVPSISLPSELAPSARALPTSASIPLPPTKDAESWPQIGKSSVNPSQGQVDHDDMSVGSKDGSEKGQVQGMGPSSKKNEKAKWVQIPPEELQAVADAFNQSTAPSKHNARSRSQRNNHQGQRSAAATAGGSKGRAALPQSQTHSGIVSQRSSVATSQSHSLAPSQSHSGIASTAQSRAQSRVHSHSGSLHSSPRKPAKGRLPDEIGPGVLTGSSGYIYSPTRLPPRVLSPCSNLPPPDLPVVSPVPVYGEYYVPPPPAAPHITIPLSLSQGHSPQSQSGYRSPYHPPGPNDFVVPNYPIGEQSSVPLPQGYPYHGYPHQLYGVEYGQPQLQGQQYLNWNGQVDRPQDYPQPLQLQQTSSVHSPSIAPQHSQLQTTSHVSLSDNGQQDHERDMDPVIPMFGSIATNEEINVSPEAEDPKERHLVFGSIGADLDHATPSPAMAPVAETVKPKTFTAFSIGVVPGEDGPSRLRSRTRSNKSRNRAEGVNGCEPHASEQAATVDSEIKVIDLTETEPKWEFVNTELSELHAGDEIVDDLPVQHNISVVHQVEAYSPPAQEQSFGPPPTAHGLQMHMPAPTPIALPPPAPYALPSTHGSHHHQHVSDEFLEVQDFGYGFGIVSGTGVGPIMTRELRDRERDRDRERFEWSSRGGADWARGRDRRERDVRVDPQRDFRERDTQRDFRVEREFIPNVPGRPRRGSAAFSPGTGGFGAERGGFVGRRGRGLGGRGFRGLGRGNYQYHHHQQQQQQPQPQLSQTRQPPFVVTPPQSLQSHSPVETANAYYPPQTTYYPTPSFDVYQPPVPVPVPGPAAPPVPTPVSTVPFPLDPVRWQLLGQLEYYLSPQNMVSDFFLRQRMDNRGWVPISLIANFNRVKQLTVDERLVKEVLNLSTVVHVRGEWVRMNRWEQFVLPTAAKSTVEDNVPGGAEGVEGSRERQRAEGYVLVGDDEEEEDEVEFVMG